MTAFYREVVPDNTAVPGAVLIYQTFGSDAANYHCHVHGLFSEGAFDKEGRFYPVTGLPKKSMEEYFRLEVLGMLQKKGLISEDLIQNLLSWKNSGFSVYSEGKGGPLQKLGMGQVDQKSLRGISSRLQKMRGLDENNFGDYRF